MIIKHILTGIIIIIFTVMSVAQSSNTKNWEIFTSDIGQFQIRVPSEPEYLKKELMTSIGKMEVHSYMVAPEYKDEDPNLMYLIEYYDYPEGTFPEDSIELKNFFYTRTAQATSQDIGGELTYQAESTIDGIPGILYRCVYKNGTYIMKSRMFLLDDRFYHIKVYCEKTTSLNDEMDVFLGSFKFLD